jgi:phage anti-repressor protein
MFGLNRRGGMTLQEELEKETGIEADRHSDVYELLDIEMKYSSWLEEKIESTKNRSTTTPT